MKWIGRLLFIVIAVLLIFGIYLGNSVFEGVTQLSTPADSIKNTQEFLDMVEISIADFEADYTVEETKLTSTQDKHTIPMIHIYQEDPNQDTVILIHGLGSNKLGTLPVAKHFLELGYNIIAYDQLNAGGNTGMINTFGYLESYDTLDVINHTDDLIDADKKLIVWGTSFGSATAAIAAGRDDSKIDGIILDSAMSNGYEMMEPTFADIEKESSLPAELMMFAGDIASKIRLGFGYDDLDAVESLKGTKVPLLIIQSKDDTVTPYSMAEAYHQAIPHSQLITTDGKHSMAYINHAKEYKDWLKEFLEKI